MNLSRSKLRGIRAEKRKRRRSKLRGIALPLLRLKRLEEIIKQYGWPGRSMVGADASLAAFLILQHADYEYQKKYLPIVKEAEKKGEIESRDVALLEDRILMREGKKQIYGTQLRRNEKTGILELYPVDCFVRAKLVLLFTKCVELALLGAQVPGRGARYLCL